MMTNAQVRTLMREYSLHGRVEKAAMKAEMTRNTAMKYLAAGKLPSDLKTKRDWRTRPDPFLEDWPAVEEWLRLVPELEAVALFEYLMEERPGKYEEGQLRTFQRRCREWQAKYGPDREVFFAQEHRPGEAMQLDFTDATELGVTIAGEPFPHRLSHLVLPYSNWEHASTCRSESMLAVRRGLRLGLMKLQHVTEYLQMDNSTAATHRPGAGEEDVPGQASEGRRFNVEFEAVVKHYGMKPRTIAIGKSEQNGDVEAANGVLKRRLDQLLRLRGSRDFGTVEEYEAWLTSVVDKANGRRQKRFAEEAKHLRPLRADVLPEYREEEAPVLTWSTMNVMRNIYSVPARLIGKRVQVRIYEDRLEVYYCGTHQLTAPRLTGRSGAAINYRHVVGALLRKPGAFARYKYREQMFPTPAFRKTYDAFSERMVGWRADLEYIRVLKLAADTMEAEVAVALELLLDGGCPFDYEAVKTLAGPRISPAPSLPPLVVQLSEYDGLLAAAREVAA